MVKLVLVYKDFEISYMFLAILWETGALLSEKDLAFLSNISGTPHMVDHSLDSRFPFFKVKFWEKRRFP